MDKETLSNYGWIVICVLVLAVMIALATPFGAYTSNAVASTTNGLFETEKNALAVVGIDVDNGTLNGDGTITQPPTPDELLSQGIVPEGATYYVGVKSTSVGDYTGATTIYTAGQTLPETVNTGDVFVYGDYEYRYRYRWNLKWQNSLFEENWSVRVVDDTKTEYGAILESINGQPVTSMVNTFSGCKSLTIAPTIPNSVTNMASTFAGCTSLDDASNIAIPSGVTNIYSAFLNCTSLTTAPDMSNATSLTEMDYTFYGCTALEIAPVIPSNVTDMECTFYGCTSLTGDIEINATPTIYYQCFEGTQITSISGDCTIKDKLLATK